MNNQPAQMAIQLPGVDFAQMARELIAAKLTEAMVGSDDAIATIVASALATKVCDRGTVSGSNYENRTPYVEWLAQDMIRAATIEVMNAKVESMRPLLAKLIEKQLKASASAYAKTLTDSFIAAAKSGWGIKVDVALAVKSRD